MSKGLYFYKLQSNYKEDVTKDCKLTINEIDHNFVTLKDADIKDIAFDEESKVVSLIRNNEEELRLDLSTMVEGITTNLEVDYDSVDGVITISHNGKTVTIDRLITEDNLHSEALTEVITDGTLSGLGTNGKPLGIAAVEKTGTFAPAIRLIDLTKGEFMPKPQHLVKGDRYVTYENVSDFGYLYNYAAVKKINEDLEHGWRIPTKEDWDNMLNAIEPCDNYRNHDSALANNMLGKVAGKLLKSKEFWRESDNCVVIEFEDAYDSEIFDTEEFEEFEIVDTCARKRPKQKRIKPNGIDAYKMRIVPAGFSDGCEIVDYFGKRGIYWANTTINETDVYVKRFDYDKAGVIQNVESPRNLFSIRLVKDYDGSNHQQVEFINGMNYTTALMPSENTKHGFAIWTTMNVAFPNEKYHPVEPNNGEGLSFRKVYCINEWNGFDWEKRQMKEGESIVLMTGLDGEHNIEYRIMNGVLYSEAATIYDKIMDEIEPVLDRMDSEIKELQEIVGEGFVDENGDRITITDKVCDIETTVGTGFTDENGEKITITDKLKQEIEDRIAADQQLREDLDEEIAARIEADERLQEAIEEEARQREEADTLLQEEINRIEVAVGLDEEGNYIPTEGNYTSEATTIAEAIDNLDTSLKIEEESRIAQDDVIEASVGLAEDGSYIKREDSFYINEGETVVGAIDLLDKALKAEEIARIEQDAKLQEEIDNIESNVGLDEEGNYIKREDSNYINAAETVVGAIDELDKALKAEEEARIEADAKLQAELDNTQANVGLDEEGNYIKREDSNYINAAETVVGAIDELDKALKVEETERIAQDDKIEASVGLAEDGSYIKREDSNYINDSETVVHAIDLLDKALKDEEVARIVMDNYLHSRLIKAGEQPNESPNIAFDCANGVLTLYTEDPKNNIIVRLNGDYGIFPYIENNPK